MLHIIKRATELIFFYGLLVYCFAVDNETTTFISDSSSEYSDLNTVQGLEAASHLSSDSPANTAGGPASFLSASTESTSSYSYLTEYPTKATETVRHSVGRGIPVPHYHLPDSRWGPFFEEGPEPHNISARVGSTVMLDCRIGLLQDKTVTWLHHKEDSIHLLTVGRSAHSRDDRITLSFRYPNNFRLQIDYVTLRDGGLYECHIATHPPKVKRTYLLVRAPNVTLSYMKGRESSMTDFHAKLGSLINMTCTGEDFPIDKKYEIVWKRGDHIITKGISSNYSDTIMTSYMEDVVSDKTYEGNYSCSIGPVKSNEVQLLIPNGELPAAVHDGNGVSSKDFSPSLIFLLLVCLMVRNR